MSESDAYKPQHQIAELKVSGHTMALDPGMYCVFSAPNSVLPSPETGLPTVRISAAPGPVAGRVEVVGLHENGWIGPESATLVRVGQARSNVLVTVYQAKDTRAEAPQIQVVRISSEPPAAAAAPASAIEAAKAVQAPDKPSSPKEVHVVAHIYGRGDVGQELGAWVGEPGSKRWIEGFAVAPVGEVTARNIEYQAVLGRGWLSPWSEGGQFCGSRSMALPILGLRVRLRGASAETHRIVLSATFIDGSKVGPVSDGEPCEAASLAALESFQLTIEPQRGRATETAAASGKAPGRVGAPAPALKTATAKRGAKPSAATAPEPAAAPPAKRAKRVEQTNAPAGAPAGKAAARTPTRPRGR